MFWGLIMEPNKRYTQVVEKPFHISQAAMDISTGDNEPCQVMVVVDSKNFLVCTLQKNKTIQTPLDMYFKTGDSVSFLTNGKCNVHLTGYLDPEYREDGSDDEEDEEEDDEEEEEEAPALMLANNKRKLETNHGATASKKVKVDKKATKKAAAAAAADSSDDEDDDENQLQKLLEGEENETDDNDESFKLNEGEGDDSDGEEDEEEEEEEEDSFMEDSKQKKNKGSESSEAETTLDTSKEETKIDMSKLTKSQKRRLKKKLQQQAKQKQPQMNGVEKAKKEDGKQKEKKKPEKEAQDVQATDKKEKKSLAGGVAIEDMKVGSGPVAKAGKVVMVYYEGRLKQNNKMFDNCLKGPGFKFRLGSKEVISGWDVGIAGMKVGGKRKIICPPAMAYGAKGSPPVIPPNSTLVFEVELKNVK